MLTRSLPPKKTKPYAPCIEYVTYIYHRFKAKCMDKYSVGGTSQKKTVDLRLSKEKHDLLYRTIGSKIWNGFPSCQCHHFSFQVQRLHTGKPTWNLKKGRSSSKPSFLGLHIQNVNFQRSIQPKKWMHRMRCTFNSESHLIFPGSRVACSHKNRRPRSGYNEHNWCACETPRGSFVVDTMSYQPLEVWPVRVKILQRRINAGIKFTLARSSTKNVTFTFSHV